MDTDSTVDGAVDPDVQMGVILNVMALLREVGAPLSAQNIRVLVDSYGRLSDLVVAATNRQLTQMALLGFVSPLPANDLWELTDNDYAAGLREETTERVAPFQGALRARATRLARRRPQLPEMAPHGHSSEEVPAADPDRNGRLTQPSPLPG